jgi:hypothetical protein
MTHYSREQIGLRAPRGKYLLDLDDVKGIAVHWPAISKPLGNPERVMSALRAIQEGHMNTDQIADGGASDIAYQVAVDQAGNTYRLRGLRYRSAANGGTEVNLQYGAVLAMLAIGEEPSDALIRGLRGRIAAHRRIFTRSRLVVGHGQIRPTGPTSCPGPDLQRLIDAGRLTPTKEHK